MHSDRHNPRPPASRPRHRDRWPLPTAEQRTQHEPADPGDRLDPNRRPTTNDAERDLVGGFSRTSSMPWLSWSISADRCRVGSRLWDIEGSVCQGCYARTRHYRQKNVATAMERRFEKLTDLDRWAGSMIDLLGRRTPHYGIAPQ